MRLDLTAQSESAVYGVITISGLLVLVAERDDMVSYQALFKVVATMGVFWLAHVYAATVAHLGDPHEADEPIRSRLARAVGVSVANMWGMLLVTLIPVIVLSLGVLGLISHEAAVWGTLWLDVALLAVLGYLEVAGWTPKVWARALGGLITAAFGMLLVALKSWIN